MSALDTLAVSTAVGLTLELAHHREGHAAGHVSATLEMPTSIAPHASWMDRQCAFLAGGPVGGAVHITGRSSQHIPPTLWIGSAAVHIDDATASTVQAWLDSRPRKGAQPCADTLPRDNAAPAAPELQA